jgi:hypothetical protein
MQPRREGRAAMRRLRLLPAEPLGDRPRIRADCVRGPRPCPWIGCRYSLYLEADPRYGFITYNFPDREPESMPPHESCALDVAERGAQSTGQIGRLLNVSSERVRQIITSLRLREKFEGPLASLLFEEPETNGGAPTTSQPHEPAALPLPPADIAEELMTATQLTPTSTPANGTPAPAEPPDVPLTDRILQHLGPAGSAGVEFQALAVALPDVTPAQIRGALSGLGSTLRAHVIGRGAHALWVPGAAPKGLSASRSPKVTPRPAPRLSPGTVADLEQHRAEIHARALSLLAQLAAIDTVLGK